MITAIRKFFKKFCSSDFTKIYEEQKIKDIEKKHQQLLNGYNYLESNQKINFYVMEALLLLSKEIALGNADLKIILKVSKTVSKAYDIDEIFYARIDKYTWEKEFSYIKPDSNYRSQMNGTVAELPDFKAAIQAQECYVINSPECFLNETDEIYYSSKGIKSLCVCPVIVNDQVIGGFGFNKTTECKWTRHQINICNIFAMLIATQKQKDMLIINLANSQIELQSKCDIIESTMRLVDAYVWNKDENGVYRYASENWLPLFFDLPKDFNITGKTDKELLDEYRKRTGNEHTYGNVCVGTDQHCMDIGKTCYYFEAGYINKQLFLLEVVKTPIYNDDKCIGTVGVARDRSKEEEKIKLLIAEYERVGFAENLTQNTMYDDGVVAYWIKDEDSFTHISLKKEIFPR